MEKKLRKKLNTECSLLSAPPYRWQCIGDNLQVKATDMVAIAERAKYGVSTKDVWSLDSYLLIVLYNGLKILKSQQYGYPHMLTPEQWNDELDKAVAFCETLMIDPLLADSPWFENYQNKLDNHAPIEEIEKARDEWKSAYTMLSYERECAKNDLMDWLKRYGEDLWW